MNEHSSLKNWLSFATEQPCRYGDRFTIVSMPSNAERDSLTISFGVEVGSAKVHLTDEEPASLPLTPGSSFVVLRCSTSDGKTFYHRAVPAEELERASEAIEESTRRLLKGAFQLKR